MKSSSVFDQALAVFRKDWQAERQSKQGFFTALQFGFVTVVAIAFAGFNSRPGASLAAGLLCVALLFTAVLTLPRGFLAEDDQGTFPWLVRLAKPEAIYFGKLLFATSQIVPTGIILGVMFSALTSREVVSWPLLLVGISVQSAAFAAVTCLAGLLVIGASNRWMLVAALSIPLLLPQTTMTVVSLRSAYGFGDLAAGWRGVAGMAAFLLASVATGPLLARELLSRR
jgi:ABC-type transport system involved in cytochrome c biogenesis permease component